MTEKKLNIASQNHQLTEQDRIPRLISKNNGLIVKNIGKRFKHVSSVWQTFKSF